MNLRTEGRNGKHPIYFPFSHHLLRRVLLFLLSLTAVSVSTAYGQPSNVMYIGDLNGDCQADTVRGKEYGVSRSFLPSQIVWGVSDSSSSPCTGATVHAGGSPSGGPVVPMTQIVYPTTWANFSGSASFLRYNRNDALPDMLLFLWGDAPPSGSGSPHGEAPARALVLFGQSGLDTLPIIIVGNTVYPVQSEPFMALDLQLGTHLVEPRLRDYTGVASYELMPIAFIPEEGGEEPPKPLVSVSEAEARGVVSVYPNPAELWARLESTPLASGRYTIVVVGVNGVEYHSQEVELSEGMKLERELSLERLPSGTYMVRLSQSGKVLSSQAIMVIH